MNTETVAQVLSSVKSLSQEMSVAVREINKCVIPKKDRVLSELIDTWSALLQESAEMMLANIAHQASAPVQHMLNQLMDEVNEQAQQQQAANQFNPKTTEAVQSNRADLFQFIPPTDNGNEFEEIEDDSDYEEDDE